MLTFPSDLYLLDECKGCRVKRDTKRTGSGRAVHLLCDACMYESWLTVPLAFWFWHVSPVNWLPLACCCR